MREQMDHNLFKPKTFLEGQHAVVGDCNGFTMEQRYEAETPAFARQILRYARREAEILDYGCGVGRIAKEILNQNPLVYVTGTDASAEMMKLAEENVNSISFSTIRPQNIDMQFDIVYLVYVLQHIPAIEIREVLQRIHRNLKDSGTFIFCSSLYRMAIRFDGAGFCDDRFLGVDLLAEIDRYFELEGPLFQDKDYENNPILEKMITGKDGGLPHPAYVYNKRKIVGELFNAVSMASESKIVESACLKSRKTGIVEGDASLTGKEENRGLQEKGQERQEIALRVSPREQSTNLLLINRLAPGDILVMTNAIRDLHKAYPGRFKTAVRTPCNEIFQNNPYITDFVYDEQEYQRINGEFSKLSGICAKDKHVVKMTGGILAIDMHYPKIHTSGVCGWHFSYGHTGWLEEVLGIPIPVTDIRPEIYPSQTEKDWCSPAALDGVDHPYWVINAGSKGDFTLKQYPYYQEVVNILKDRIQLVQVGVKGHNHIPLEGVHDMVGKTNNIRDLLRVIYHAQGVISCVSFPMHIAAAFNKPCVVVAGAREGTRWELYPSHQFLYVNGCLTCAPYDGCWRSKVDECNNKREGIPLCMKLIKPEDIARAVDRYYEGGMIEQELGVRA